MSLLQVDSISKSFGTLELFQDLTFTIEKGQKIGLIAPNGAGKTTLLNILVGREQADSGTISTARGMRLAYLPQKSDFSEYDDVLSACMSSIRPELRSLIKNYEKALQSGEAEAINKAIAQMDAQDGWAIERELTALLSKLQIKDTSRSPQGLSGGETKRIAIAATLLGDPDLMIMDEPTNHLDPDTIEWLEGHLLQSQLSLLIVTHDRYFLDKVCDTILELDQGQLYTYEGNYSRYLELRDARIEQLRVEQQTLRNAYRRELEWMRRQPQARGTKARHRVDSFYELEGRLGTIDVPTGPRLDADKVYIGKKIFEAKNLSKTYDGKRMIIKDFTYNFARRDRVGVVGANGSGKTTLINLIMGNLEPTSGTVEVGETVCFGYFSQQPFAFDQEKKVIDVVTDIADQIEKEGGKPLSAMQLLTRFLFPPSRQQDYVHNLSGGELRRLQLCTVLMHAPNFLVLDEPTNDLDIPTLQVLEEYLMEYDGCLLIVSHDRYFMDRLTDHLFVLTGDGSVRDFPGNFTDYRMKQKSESQERIKEEVKRPIAVTTTRPQRERKKRRSYKEEREFEALNNELPTLEKQLEELEESMSSGALSPEALQEASVSYQALKDELDTKEMRWLELSELDG
ncbi:MAG: ABC-F family ATP-binding cassette domain-containing protein [Porphyromonas sp.]|nr:ABC-F family ATP-binding cassette domain-containing protein [Porphyromonas sp.]